MQDFIQFVTANWDVLLGGFGAIAVALAGIARITPNESDNKVADVLIKIVNVLGYNQKANK